jgi:hypothetical protein
LRWKQTALGETLPDDPDDASLRGGVDFPPAVRSVGFDGVSVSDDSDDWLLKDVAEVSWSEQSTSTFGSIRSNF